MAMLMLSQDFSATSVKFDTLSLLLSANQLPVHDLSQEVDCWVPIWTNRSSMKKKSRTSS